MCVWVTHKTRGGAIRGWQGALQGPPRGQLGPQLEDSMSQITAAHGPSRLPTPRVWNCLADKRFICRGGRVDEGVVEKKCLESLLRCSTALSSQIRDAISASDLAARSVWWSDLILGYFKFHFMYRLFFLMLFLLFASSRLIVCS